MKISRFGLDDVRRGQRNILKALKSDGVIIAEGFDQDAIDGLYHEAETFFSLKDRRGYAFVDSGEF